MTPEALFAARRAARAQARAKDQALAAAHARVFARMATDPAFDAEVRAMARQRVDRWQATQICNERYIVAWTRLLVLPIDAMAAEVLQQGAEGPALRSNTPFGPAIGPVDQCSAQTLKRSCWPHAASAVPRTTSSSAA